MGRFKGLKGTPGRPSKRKSAIKTILDANAIITSSTKKEAYKKRHPNSSDNSARNNAHRMCTPEVESLIDTLLKTGKTVEVTRDTIVRMLMVVVEGKLEGHEKTGDYINALKLLKELVPEFKDRLEVDDISRKQGQELQNEFDELIRKAKQDA